jgi:excisionase family DNA binding protein
MREPDHVPHQLRLALTPTEAAQALGCSRDFFDKHIGPELRWVRRGRLRFVAIAEVEDWLHRSAGADP